MLVQKLETSKQISHIVKSIRTKKQDHDESWLITQSQKPHNLVIILTTSTLTNQNVRKSNINHLENKLNLAVKQQT